MKHMLRIFMVARELHKTYAVIGVATILLSLMSLFLPIISGWAIDEMQRGVDARLGYVVGLAFAIFALDFLQNVLSNYSGYLGDIASARIAKILSNKYYQHLLRLPQAYFDQEKTGEIINRLHRCVNQISQYMQVVSNNLLQFLFTTIFTLIAVTFYSWQVALALSTLYPVYIYLTLRSSPRWQSYQTKKNYHSDIGTGRFTEVVAQIKVVKNYMQERRELKFLNKHLGKFVALTRPQSKYWHVKDFQRRTVLNVIFLGVFILIFYQGAQGIISPGQAVALILFAMQIRTPLFTINFLVDSTQRALANSKDYFKVIDTPIDTVDSENRTRLKVKKGEIDFRNVTFGYSEDESVISGVTFSVPSGKRAALVGESGEGKTTITNLLMRLYMPQSGTIAIDDQDISHVSRKSLQSAISVVFQEPALFSGTIRENIAYAHAGATEDQIIQAAKDANAHEFIRGLKDGYDSEIGERGIRLSGGQKQRIAIARAILKDAPILILDEATSSLDSKSEMMVQEALQRLMKNRTTLIIAHRLSTIQHVDIIITLKNGKIDEVGSPAELEKSGGLYQTLLELQRSSDPEKLAEALKKYEVITGQS